MGITSWFNPRPYSKPKRNHGFIIFRHPSGGRCKGVFAEEEEVERLNDRLGRSRPSQAVAGRCEGHVSEASSFQLGLVIRPLPFERSTFVHVAASKNIRVGNDTTAMVESRLCRHYFA